MNPIEYAVRRPFTAFVLVVVLASGGILGSSKMGVDIFAPLNTLEPAVHVDSGDPGAEKVEGLIGRHYEPSFHEQSEQPRHEHQKIVVTSPKAMDVTVTQQYVCQIRSQRHIEVCALGSGYLEEIFVKEGQRVKKGDVMFKVVPDSLQGKAGRRVGRGQARTAGVQQHQEVGRDKSSRL